jgi:hypothetical protein
MDVRLRSQDRSVAWVEKMRQQPNLTRHTEHLNSHKQIWSAVNLPVEIAIVTNDSTRLLRLGQPLALSVSWVRPSR